MPDITPEHLHAQAAIMDACGHPDIAYALGAMADGRKLTVCRECDTLTSYPTDFHEGTKATQMCGSCYAAEML